MDRLKFRYILQTMLLLSDGLSEFRIKKEYGIHKEYILFGKKAIKFIEDEEKKLQIKRPDAL